MNIQIEAGTFIAMIFNFLLLMFVLVRFLYRPIRNILRKRAEKIQGDLDSAETAKSEALEARIQARELLESAHKDAYEIVEKARGEAERVREELTAQTRQELDALRQRAQQEIIRAKERAYDQMREDSVELALAVVKKLLSRDLSSEFNEGIIRDIMAEVEKEADSNGSVN